MAAMARRSGPALVASEMLLSKFTAEKVRLQASAGFVSGDEAFDLMLSYANPSTLVDQALSDDFISVTLDYIRGRETFHRHIAEAVRFLISYKPEIADRRYAASVKKAHYVVNQNGYYGNKHDISWKRFTELWSKYKRASPFIYVNIFHFNERLSLDPRDNDFTEQIDMLLAQDALSPFFRQSRYVMDTLKSVLYEATFKGVPLPSFPADIKPLPVSTTPIDDRLKRIVASYRSP
jgi:hypothetical protein